MGWMPPTLVALYAAYGAMVATWKEGNMADVHVLAIDLAKRSFQVCAAARGGSVLFNLAVSRTKLEQMLTEQPP